MRTMTKSQQKKYAVRKDPKKRALKTKSHSVKTKYKRQRITVQEALTDAD